jgi:L-lactate dehydrogenase
VPLATVLKERGENHQQFRDSVENAVRYANIAIIEGNDASQYGIGMVCARIAEAILRDEGIVIPIGAYSPEYSVTLSLPSVLGRRGVRAALPLSLSEEERVALEKSAAKLKEAVARTAER